MCFETLVNRNVERIDSPLQPGGHFRALERGGNLASGPRRSLTSNTDPPRFSADNVDIEANKEMLANLGRRIEGILPARGCPLLALRLARVVRGPLGDTHRMPCGLDHPCASIFRERRIEIANGRQCLTKRIYPDPESVDTAFYCWGGEATLRSLDATRRLKSSSTRSARPAKIMQAKAAPALTAPTTRGEGLKAGPASDQKPACQKQRQPPPAKTTASYEP